MSDLSAAIHAAWEKRDQLGVTSKGAERDAVEAALDQLDNGSLRVAEKIAERRQDDRGVAHQVHDKHPGVACPLEFGNLTAKDKRQDDKSE